MLKLTGSEIDFYASKIAETLEEIPLFYLEEIMELAFEGRKREGDIEGLDISSSEEENSSNEDKTSSSNEDKTSSSDENNSSDSD
tara:strand:+ start:21 stop:275 length:255 start_codon:yes stop_codon:yes gene_type:complete